MTRASSPGRAVGRQRTVHLVRASRVARRSRGAAAIEWLVTAPALFFVGLGILQWALVLHARATLEHAAFHGARAGATAHADPDAIVRGMAVGLITIREPALSAVPVSQAAAPATALLLAELAGGVAVWRQLRPAPADFDDWAEPALDDEGELLAGVVEIPADNLRFRGAQVGARSGRTLVEANLLELELIYGWPMRVPLVGSLAVRWMRWFDQCPGAEADRAALARWGTPQWQLDDGAWRCPFYEAGGVARWPVRVRASVRMHVPARHAGGGLPPGIAIGSPAAAGGEGQGAAADEDAALSAAEITADPSAPAAGQADGSLPEIPGDAPASGGSWPSSTAPDVAAPDPAADLLARIAAHDEISQAEACIPDSAQAEMDVGDEEALLAPAVEALAAETVAVQAR